VTAYTSVTPEEELLLIHKDFISVSPHRDTPWCNVDPANDLRPFSPNIGAPHRV
jgi:hypothetical protein